MSSIWSEFYCHECPPDPKDDKGQKGGYFRVRISEEWNMTIVVKCPNCGHEHYRGIRGGQIVDDRQDTSADRLLVPKSDWSREPITKAMQKSRSGRNSAVISKVDDVIDPLSHARDLMLQDLWAQTAMRERNGE